MPASGGKGETDPQGDVEEKKPKRLPIGRAKRQGHNVGLTMFLGELESASRGLQGGNAADSRTVWATEAHEAAALGDVDGLRRILEDVKSSWELTGASLSESGQTPLPESGRAAPMARSDEGADSILLEISGQDMLTRQTPLMVAVENACGSCLERDVSQNWQKKKKKTRKKGRGRSRTGSDDGADDSQPEHGENCGCVSGTDREGSLQCALLLTEAMPLDTLINTVDAVGRSAFAYACRYGNATITRAFLKKARSTKPESIGRSKEGHKHTIEAVVNNLFAEGDVERGSAAAKQMALLGDQFNHTGLHLAASHAHYRVVNGMLRSFGDESGDIVNATDKFGETPLIHAARVLDLPMCKLLLSQGADPEAEGVNGTAIKVAAENGEEAEVAALRTLLTSGGAQREPRVSRRRKPPKQLSFKDTETKLLMAMESRNSIAVRQSPRPRASINSIIFENSKKLEQATATLLEGDSEDENLGAGDAPALDLRSLRNVEEGSIKTPRSARRKASTALVGSEVSELPPLMVRREPSEARDPSTIDATKVADVSDPAKYVLPHDEPMGLPAVDPFRKHFYGLGFDLFYTTCVNPTTAAAQDETGKDVHAAIATIRRELTMLPDGRQAYPALVFSPWGIAHLDIPVEDVAAVSGKLPDKTWEGQILPWLQLRSTDLSIFTSIASHDTRLRAKQLEQFLEEVLEYKPASRGGSLGKRAAMKSKLAKMKRGKKDSLASALAEASQWRCVHGDTFQTTSADLLSLEARLGFSRCLSVAVVYADTAEIARGGESAMVAAQEDGAALAAPLASLMDSLGEKIDMRTWGGYGASGKRHASTSGGPDYRYYSSWRGFHIMFHVAPFMSKDAIRRLIGNDGVLLYVLGDSSASVAPEFRSEVNRVGIVARAHERAADPGAYDWNVGVYQRQEVKSFADNNIPPRLVPTRGDSYSDQPARDLILGLAVRGSRALLESAPYLFMRYQLWKEEVTDIVDKL
jgi:Rap/ran-GAP/Ankyrin repeats (3 copies)